MLRFVEIVGGSSRIPLFQQSIEEMFKFISVGKTIDSEEAIAKGCARVALQQSPWGAELFSESMNQQQSQSNKRRLISKSPIPQFRSPPPQIRSPINKIRSPPPQIRSPIQINSPPPQILSPISSMNQDNQGYGFISLIDIIPRTITIAYHKLGEGGSGFNPNNGNTIGIPPQGLNEQISDQWVGIGRYRPSVPSSSHIISTIDERGRNSQIKTVRAALTAISINEIPSQNIKQPLPQYQPIQLNGPPAVFIVQESDSHDNILKQRQTGFGGIQQNKAPIKIRISLNESGIITIEGAFALIGSREIPVRCSIGNDIQQPQIPMNQTQYSLFDGCVYVPICNGIPRSLEKMRHEIDLFRQGIENDNEFQRLSNARNEMEQILINLEEEEGLQGQQITNINNRRIIEQARKWFDEEEEEENRSSSDYERKIIEIQRISRIGSIGGQSSNIGTSNIQEREIGRGRIKQKQIDQRKYQFTILQEIMNGCNELIAECQKQRKTWLIQEIQEMQNTSLAILGEQNYEKQGRDDNTQYDETIAHEVLEQYRQLKQHWIQQLDTRNTVNTTPQQTEPRNMMQTQSSFQNGSERSSDGSVPSFQSSSSSPIGYSLRELQRSGICTEEEEMIHFQSFVANSRYSFNLNFDSIRDIQAHRKWIDMNN
ncbi:MAG: hypothetical protein EZS28_007794 [Streblomastix strix]|uniref:Uncharacterized protein n=1 Tax=Streblomastix strix TaxID=222440 RepID=A0A5J4WRI5_9EUKA|nr:MAG: hypothetical protein EZS28_007794 [Streblomastix strix]